MTDAIVIFGIGDAAQLAHYYFTKDRKYNVAAFVVDAAYKDCDTFCGLPIVVWEDLPIAYPASTYKLFVAMGYSNVNEVRRQKYLLGKEAGYEFVSYISSRATVLNDGNIGENCFILEDNTIQPFVEIGDNVTLWSGNHVGHHSIIHSHCFIASHIVISGRVTIGEACFLGVNSTFRDNISVGEKVLSVRAH